MKKKLAGSARKSAPAKSPRAAGSAREGKAAQAGGAKGRKAAKASSADKPGKPGKPKTAASPKARTAPGVDAGSKPVPKSKAGSPAGAKSAAKGSPASAARPDASARTEGPSAGSGESRPPVPASSAGASSAAPSPHSAPASGAAPMAKPESDAPSRDERAGLDRVMASLSRIFGGRDFMSDAELDALLDDKMASGEIPPSAALDPLDEAQSLVYEAWNTEGPRKAQLARRALELSDDCADAYLILAQEEARTREAALDLYRKAFEAGRRALDPGLFEAAAGGFWGVMETRPYMRARLGLAECLWDLGRKEEALGHLRELLRLNPSDNQGVRYILLQCLLESGADEELGALLTRYRQDTSPGIAYTRALWQFRRAGRGKAAEAALADALRANPHVPAFLLKRKPLPARPPAAAEPGGPEEAQAYAAGALDAWHKTLGAVDWLASRI